MNKPKKVKLSDADIELFRANCQDVTPLKTDKFHLTQEPPLIKLRPKERKTLSFSYDEPINHCEPEERLYFARSGLQTKILNQLQRGQIKIEARLDLHQLKAEAALSTSQEFLENAQAQAYKCVLIIHGKGHFSKDGKPVLKSLLNNWLSQQAMVLAFASSQPKHGGAGALYVLLKRGGHT